MSAYIVNLNHVAYLVQAGESLALGQRHSTLAWTWNIDHEAPGRMPTRRCRAATTSKPSGSDRCFGMRTCGACGLAIRATGTPPGQPTVTSSIPSKFPYSTCLSRRRFFDRATVTNTRAVSTPNGRRLRRKPLLTPCGTGPGRHCRATMMLSGVRRPRPRRGAERKRPHAENITRH